MSRTAYPVWEWLDRLGLEAATLSESDDTIEFAGIAVTVVDMAPIRLRYAIDLSCRWAFRRASIHLESDKQTHSLVIERGGAGWTTNGQPRFDLAACDDIDIMGSPSTNTLPIRRLAWEPGDAHVLQMAYVSLPDLAVLPVTQTYSLLQDAGPGERRFQYGLSARAGCRTASDQRFEYHSVDSGFRAELRVDADGLVLDYPPYWRRAR